MKIRLITAWIVSLVFCFHLSALQHPNYIIKTTDDKEISLSSEQIEQMPTLVTIIEDFESTNIQGQPPTIDTQPPAIAFDFTQFELSGIDFDKETFDILNSLNRQIPVIIPPEKALNVLRGAKYLDSPLDKLKDIAKQTVDTYAKTISDINFHKKQLTSMEAYEPPAVSRKKIEELEQLQSNSFAFTENDIATINQIGRDWYLTNKKDPQFANITIKTDSGTFKIDTGFSIKELSKYGWKFQIVGYKALHLSNKHINNLDGLLEIEGIKEVKTLFLDHNLLSDLPANAFAELNNLTHLYLHNNKITTIDANAFAGLPQLQVLLLNYNELKQFDSKVLLPVSNLTQLDISYNKIAHVSPFPDTLKNLKKIYLDHNELKTIVSGCFFNLNALEILGLAYNKLQDLPADAFIGLQNLKELNLSHNEIKMLPSQLLHDCSKLQIFDISYNLLTTLPNDLFVNNPLLETVNLSFNQLTDLPYKLFSLINNLSRLNIKDNNLSKDQIKYLDDQLVEIFERIIIDAAEI